MNEFDAENCPLHGINLVEASAGTGKTYNIQLLVLRLLLEKEIPLQKILVVTFTVFATAELMTRLHSILLVTLEAFELCGKDPSLIETKKFDQVRNIVKREVAKGEARSGSCVALIKAALADFDQASVMTIHGFCQRMLLDHAFASKVSFGIELKKDIGEIRHRIAMDFIRMIRCSTQPGFVLGRKLDGRITADKLLEQLSPALSNSENGATICWRDAPAGSWQAQLKALNDQAADVDDGTFKPNALGPCFMAFYREQLAKIKAEENFFTFDDLIRLMADTVRDEKNGAALRAAIRENYQYAFVDEFQDTDPLQYEIFSRIFGTDDDQDESRGFFMIGDPKQAIYSFRGGDIAAYRNACAKVPEAQRYTLSRNFRSSEEYIGVLNGFFADMKAEAEKTAEEAKSKGKSKGKSKAEVKNEAKAEAENEDEKIAEGEKFEVPKIEFGGSEKCALYRDGNPEPRPVEKLLQFECVEKVDEVKGVTVDKVLELLSAGYVLYDKEKKTSRPVSASDIAILFPTKRQGALIESQLNKEGIDTVWMSESDIFSKPEAKALYDLLKLLCDGCSFRQILPVLAGDLFQCSATELCNLQNIRNEKRFEGQAEAAQAYFLDLRKTWESQGFYFMFRRLMFAPNSDRRQWLVAISDAPPERPGRFEEDGTLAQHLIYCDFIEGRYKLGRLRQLGEILHQAEQARQLSPGRLLNFLFGKITHDSSDKDDDTAALIQRCTDLDAVRMLTLHSSKGLQFPIVLIPFFINYNNPQKPSLLFHEESKRCVDMTGWSGEKRKHTDVCEEEKLDERTRLLYVGVTRAKYFCYLSFADSGYGRLKGKLPLDKEQYQAQRVRYDKSKEDSSREGDGESELRRFDGKIVHDWNPVSFSGIVRFRNGGQDPAPPAGEFSQQDFYGGTDELSADDGPEESAGANAAGRLPGDDEQECIFKFGSGSEMGTVWHEIFEKMNFDPPGLSADGCFDDGEREAVLNALEDRSLYNYIRRHRDEDEESRKRDLAFARMLKGVLYNPMGPMDDRFMLHEIPANRRVSEMKFIFVLKENVTLPQIKECLEKYHISTGSWAAAATVGYRDKAMVGFIDLLCQSGSGKYYIIDWKSNRLNSDMTDFHDSGMQAEVDKKLYSLQYLLYTVGLWHFLKARRNIDLTKENYEQHFGGVLYLFIRGIAAPLRNMDGKDAETCRKRGIFFKLPPFELIKELKGMLDIRPLAPSAAAERTGNIAAEAEK